VSRFHAYDCNNLVNEFQCWSRNEADYFCAQLRKIIIEADVAAYGIACSRKDYDRMITGEYRPILGPTAEAMCINQCFVRTLAWVQANTFDPNMQFVFDNRPSPVRRYAGTVYDAFEAWLQPPPVLRGYAFKSSLAVRPLQAADLIAWEMYQHANDCLKYGIGPPRREELRELRKNMDFTAQFASPASIVKIRDFWVERYREKPGLLDNMAKHFTEFDPENPDYSHLSDNPAEEPA